MVPWRIAFGAIAIVAALVAGFVVLVRANGFQAINATAPRATSFFIDPTSGNIVLVDGYAGRTLAHLESGANGLDLEIAEGGDQAVVVDRGTGSIRKLDGAALRLGPAEAVSTVAQVRSVVAVTQPGFVAADPSSGQATLLSSDGSPIPFPVGRDSVQIAPDGSVWSIIDDELRRFTTTSDTAIAAGLHEARFTLVGDTPLVLVGSLARFGDGEWWEVPAAGPRWSCKRPALPPGAAG